jgi:hypothetical protein
MRQQHARAQYLRQIFRFNLLIAGVISLIALTQHSWPDRRLRVGAPDLSQTPPSVTTVARDATLRPTPTVGAPPTASPPALDPLGTPVITDTPVPVALPPSIPAARTRTPTATAVPTSRAHTQTPTTRASPTPAISITWPITQVLGNSTLGWPIEAYQFGDGKTRLAFIGGLHGGYEWNSILLAYEAIDHYAAHPERIPAAVSLYIVPSANPDGQVRVLGHAGRFTSAEVPTDTIAGRLNGNDVDLNRNWDQNWAPVGTWRDQEVSGGDAPFSEVETQILRDWFLTMDAVVMWHSASPGVYVASCDDVYAPSLALGEVYADAAQYPLYESFDDYAITGGASDWLACAGIPAIAVELTNHTETDGEKNLAAMRAVIETYSGALVP